MDMMQWYEPEVRQLERRQPALAGARPPVFYGSSTIRLWQNLAQDLECPNALNLGFGGSTLEACAYFFDRLVTPLGPGSLVVYAGDNDLGDGRTPDQVLSFFRQLAAKVEQRFPEIPFGFISVKPSPARFSLADRIMQTNRAIEQALTSNTNAFYISVYDAMLDDEKAPRRELFLGDGLHLAPAGYELWDPVATAISKSNLQPILDQM